MLIFQSINNAEANAIFKQNKTKQNKTKQNKTKMILYILKERQVQLPARRV